MRVRVQCPHWPHWHWHDQRSHGLNVCPSLPWQRANHCPNLVKGQLSLPVLLQWEAGFIRIQTDEQVSLPVSALTFLSVNTDSAEESFTHSYVLSFNQYDDSIVFWSWERVLLWNSNWPHQLSLYGQKEWGWIHDWIKKNCVNYNKKVTIDISADFKTRDLYVCTFVFLLLQLQLSDIVSEQLQLLIVKVCIFHRPERRQRFL